MDLMPPHRNDIEFIKGSITDQSAVQKSVTGAEIVYHLATVSNIDLVKESPYKTIELNILGTASVLEWSRREKIKRFLYATSIYIYDKGGHLYTSSKIASKMLCKNYQTLYNLPYTILRFATAYGPRSRKADVVSIFVEQAIEGNTLLIQGSGQQTRNFIYVVDLAEGAVLALGKENENEVLTLAGGEPVTICDLAKLIQGIFHGVSDIVINESEAREDDISGNIENWLKTASNLRWQPNVNLEDGIRRYAEWYTTTPNGGR